MEQIRRADIPLRIKNVKNPDGNGTIIYPSPSNPISRNQSTMSLPLTPSNGVSSFMSANGYYGISQSRRTPTAITTKDSVVLINIQSNRQRKCPEFLAQVFHVLNQNDTVTDLITSSEQSVSLAISSLDTGEKIVNLVSELEKCGNVEIFRGMAIVSIIGHKMRNMVGIAGEMSTIRSKYRQKLINCGMKVKFSQHWRQAE
jgi:aspartate kinase